MSKAKLKYYNDSTYFWGHYLMLKYLHEIAAFLLLLSGTHATALDWLGNPEGKAGDANDVKNAATLSISGTAFEDSNGNARFDYDERSLSGWIVRLKLDGREIANTTTDKSGRYSFTNIKPGNYIVMEDQEAGWEPRVPGSGYRAVNLSDKSVDKVDFGSARFPKIYDQDIVDAASYMTSDIDLHEFSHCVPCTD